MIKRKIIERIVEVLPDIFYERDTVTRDSFHRELDYRFGARDSWHPQVNQLQRDGYIRGVVIFTYLGRKR